MSLGVSLGGSLGGSLGRVRWVLARHPWIYWSTVAACVALVWSGLADSQARTDAARRAWGTPRQVWVATAPAAPGDTVHATARQYPAAMVPKGALARAPDRVAAQQIAEGEVLVGSDLADAHLGAQWVVFALPRQGAPRLVEGAGVAVFADGRRVCDGTVSALGAETIDVAVPPACAGDTSAQVKAGTVVLARLP